MKQSTHPNRPHLPYARLAGVFYLIILAAGLWSELGVRAQLLHPGDALATWDATRAALPLFRWGLAADTAMILSDIALAVLLFALFRPVQRDVALAALVLRLMQAALIGASLLALLAGLHLVQTGTQADARVLLNLYALHGAGYDFGLIFFGANTVLTAWLLCRSGWTGAWLPGLLMAAGGVYLAGSVTRFMAPDWNLWMQPAYLVPVVAETAFAFVLLVGLRRS